MMIFSRAEPSTAARLSAARSARRVETDLLSLAERLSRASHPPNLAVVLTPSEARQLARFIEEHSGE